MQNLKEIYITCTLVSVKQEKTKKMWIQGKGDLTQERGEDRDQADRYATGPESNSLGVGGQHASRESQENEQAYYLAGLYEKL